MRQAKNSERGQTLVIMIFGLVGLLMVAGLAIDGGMVTLERRRMQNAADASSVGGTRKLAEFMCDEDVSATAADAAIWAEVKRYAQSNGVNDPDNNVVAEYMGFDANGEVARFIPRTYVGNSSSGGIGVPPGASGISATVEISRSTYFVSLMGIEHAGASAPAIAMTGPPLTGGGIRPVGVPDEIVRELVPGVDNFQIDFDNGEITWATGASQLRGWLNLGFVWNQSPALDEENQGWPRVTCTQGASCKKLLDDWMADGWNGTLYIGDYIHSYPGATTSKICTAPEDTLLYVPIYDEHGGYDCEDISEPKPTCPTAGGYCYHIVGFAGVKITDCQKAPEKEITMHLVQVIRGEGTPSPSSGYGSEVCEETTIWSVSLWE